MAPGRCAPEMKPKFQELLAALQEGGVDFIVVGGVAALLEGAPILTLDLDIVYATDDRTLRRWAEVLADLDATYRDPAGRQIPPTAERLRTNRVNLLETRLGLLDLLQTIGDGWTFSDLLPDANEHEVGGVAVRVLDLSVVIESKILAGRDKDTAMLPVLRRTLEMRRQEDDGSEG